MRNALIFLAVLFITPILCSCRTDHSSERGEGNRVVHLSLDDVELFGDLISNQQDYDSLFQHPLMAFLKELHDDYGMRITLYTYEYFPCRDGYTRIGDMPLKYKQDFLRASDWLKIGYHSQRTEFNSLVSVVDFSNSYNNLNTAVANFADSAMIASTLRLHYFFAPDSLLNPLTGVKYLLCADDINRPSYNLTPSESLTVGNGEKIVKNGISYIKTDLRLDDNYHILSDLKHREDADTLVLFIHEWKLWHNPERYTPGTTAGEIVTWSKEHSNRILLKNTVKWLYEAGYGFSFLE